MTKIYSELSKEAQARAYADYVQRCALQGVTKPLKQKEYANGIALYDVFFKEDGQLAFNTEEE
jgi:hypothetical protein